MLTMDWRSLPSLSAPACIRGPRRERQLHQGRRGAQRQPRRDQPAGARARGAPRGRPDPPRPPWRADPGGRAAGGGAAGRLPRDRPRRRGDHRQRRLAPAAGDDDLGLRDQLADAAPVGVPRRASQGRADGEPDRRDRRPRAGRDRHCHPLRPGAVARAREQPARSDLDGPRRGAVADRGPPGCRAARSPRRCRGSRNSGQARCRTGCATMASWRRARTA